MLRKFSPIALALVVVIAGATWVNMTGQIFSLCGNGKIDPQEQCDDANSNNTDGCTTQCTREIPQNVQELLPYDSYFLDAFREQLIHPKGALTLQTGITYSPTTHTWNLSDTASPIGDIAHGAYNITYVTEAAVNVAEATKSPELINELAQFYIDYYQKRFTTLGELRDTVRQNPQTLTGYLINMNSDGSLKNNVDPDSIQTLAWYERISHPTVQYRVRECKLCMMQFYISPARLIRVIASIPSNERTSLMTEFVREYSGVMINDHLLRYDNWYKAQWSLPKDKRLIGDTDLMQMSAIADMLGAHEHDPLLVSLDSETKDRLLSLLQTGVAAVKLRANYHPDTTDWQGNIVGSMDLFEGDFDTYVDYRYANYDGPIPPYPDLASIGTPEGAGYDIAHAWRFPQSLRSLYDNSDLLGLPFPTAEDMRLLANQYTYKVFTGDLDYPQLQNFMDGRDTWYRVGYGTNYIGLAPTEYCYTFDREYRSGAFPYDRAVRYPCLAGFNGRIGWGRLAEFQPDLQKLLHATLDLMHTTDPARIAFRERYFTYANNEPFQFWSNGLQPSSNADPWYMLLPFALLSDLANPAYVGSTHTSAGDEPVTVALPDSNHPIAACHSDSFARDAAVCINQIVEAYTGNAKLILNIAPGTYTLETQTFTLVNVSNIELVGTGTSPDQTIFQMSAATARNRNDLYFMMQMFNSSNIAVRNLTLDGANLSGERGIGVCALPLKTSRNITVERVHLRNFSLYGMIAGNIYSSGLVNVPATGAYPTLTKLYTLLRALPQSDRYCSGNVSGITFEGNNVDIGSTSLPLKSMGVVVVPYVSKQPLGNRPLDMANWKDTAKSIASRNTGITIRNNSFRGISNEVDSGILIQNSSNVNITGNTFTDAGFTKGYRSGGQINLGFNVWNVDISKNRFYLSRNTEDRSRGVVLANGFDQQSLYGYGQGVGLRSPVFNVSVHDNSFSNAQIRFVDCCKSTDASATYCTNPISLSQLSDENLTIRNNADITKEGKLSSLLVQMSRSNPGTNVCRPYLNGTFK